MLLRPAPADILSGFFDIPLEHPVVTLYSPIYSNVAFQILAYALENITSTLLSTLFTDRLARPLKLNEITDAISNHSASSLTPTTKWYNASLRDETPADGFYSSISDMRCIGFSILNSTLLLAQTRRRIKPKFHPEPKRLRRCVVGKLPVRLAGAVRAGHT